MTQVTYSNYSHLALRTESPIDAVLGRVNKRNERYLRLIHSALGLCSETEELKQSYGDADSTNTFGELGDLWWFVNVGYRALNCDANYENLLQTVVSGYDRLTVGDLIEDLFTKVSGFQDHIKAHLFYGREEFKLPPDIKLSATTILVADLNAITLCLHYLTAAICRQSDIPEAPGTVLDVLKANIAKLRARYPDAYSEVAANERSNDIERKAIDTAVHAGS